MTIPGSITAHSGPSRPGVNTLSARPVSPAAVKRSAIGRSTIMGRLRHNTSETLTLSRSGRHVRAGAGGAFAGEVEIGRGAASNTRIERLLEQQLVWAAARCSRGVSVTVDEGGSPEPDPVLERGEFTFCRHLAVCAGQLACHTTDTAQAAQLGPLGRRGVSPPTSSAAHTRGSRRHAKPRRARTHRTPTSPAPAPTA